VRAAITSRIKSKEKRWGSLRYQSVYNKTLRKSVQAFKSWNGTHRQNNDFNRTFFSIRNKGILNYKDTESTRNIALNPVTKGNGDHLSLNIWIYSIHKILSNKLTITRNMKCFKLYYCLFRSVLPNRCTDIMP